MVAFSTPQKSVFQASEQFKIIFPQTLIVTGLLIALLSITQIRKILHPVETLMRGTQAISEGKYDEPVVINSGDEFEELGESFNNMRVRIQDQIHTLQTMSDIDRLILSRPDRHSIIRTVIKYIRYLVEVQHINIIVIDDEKAGFAEMHINIDNSFTEIDTQRITLTEADMKQIRDCEDHVLLDRSVDLSFTRQQRILGDNHFLLLSIVNNGVIVGAICVSTVNDMNSNESRFQNLKDLADRVAVALANAEWEDKLFQQAHYDTLTELPNRFLFRDRLELAIENTRRNDVNVAVMFVDLDRFKTINDSLGHSAGDRIIQEVGKLLLKCVRRYDTVARFGGDEFLIIIPDVKKVDAMVKKASKVAERILNRLSSPFLLDEREVYVSVSIGITIAPRDSDDYDQILINADTAMYHAKAQGRNNYQFYASQHERNSLEKLNLENDLRNALSRNEFELLYQPKIDTEKSKIVGVEALIRWQHPQFGLINTDEFIRLAEESGLISKIGYWVLQNACRQSRHWQDEFAIDVQISVNVSSEQFRRTQFLKKPGRLLRKTRSRMMP